MKKVTMPLTLRSILGFILAFCTAYVLLELHKSFQRSRLRPQHEYENSIQAIYVIHLYTKQLQLQNIDQNSIVS